MNYRLSIDPGLLGTGWALWTHHNWRDLSRPTQTGIKVAKRTGSIEDRVGGLSRDIHHLCISNNVDTVYIEQPAFFDSVHGSMVAKRGDLFRLIFLVGAIYGTLHYDTEVILVPVNKWKGQLPKRVVERNIRRVLGPDNCRSFKTHIWDAVGIGLYAKGFFG